ncbi:MAG TPA: hypothetical protein VN607_13740 [Gemmatimonadaceae bacterium]|nr:hypothetical protein [Gemmatimonadaceae bacterium]
MREMTADGPVMVTLSGLLRGQDLAGDAQASLDEDALRLDRAGGAVRLPFDRLDGARYAVGTLELFMARGDIIALGGPPELAGLAAALDRRAMAVPEVTRSLRGLGSTRASPGAEHDRYFGPLLAARREAESATGPERARAAFDAVSLRAAMLQRLREVAAERHPSEPPERRALEAELSEVAEPLVAALGALQQAQDALASSDDADRFARWRAWAAALRSTFEMADEVWLSLVRVLAANMPTPRRSGVRRWLGHEPREDA